MLAIIGSCYTVYMNPQDPNNQAQPTPEQPGQEPQLQQPVSAEPLPDTDATTPYDTTEEVPEPAVEEAPLQWEAQEYIHLDKGTWWYVLFALVAIGLIAADIFLLRSWTFTVLVIVMSIAVIVYVRRPPRTLQYTLSPKQGLYVGEKLYPWEEFKAFGIIEDHGHQSLMLIPIKRFAPGVSVYFPEEIGEDLVDLLAKRLPIEDLKLDAVDLLIRKLRL